MDKRSKPGKWLLYTNKSWTKPNGCKVIQSGLRPCYALTMSAFFALWVSVQLPSVSISATFGIGAFIAAVLCSVSSRFEINDKQLVLWRYSRALPAIRVPLVEVVMGGREVVFGQTVSHQEAKRRFWLDIGPPYESDDNLLFITYRSKELNHVFDDAFA